MARGRRLPVVLTAVLVGAGLAACGDDPPVDPPIGSTVRGPTQLVEARLDADGTLTVNPASCNGDPEVTALEEDADEVRLEVTATTPAPGEPGDACLDGLTVDLDEPLGGRTLVDLATGDAVPVEAAPG